MNGQDIYKQQQAVGWTRVDMLLVLYDAAIQNLTQAVEAHMANDSVVWEHKRMHAVRIALELQSGLDHSLGELPSKVAQLCEYVQHAALTGGVREVQSAIEVLTTLKEGFDSIREEAIELERIGVIPPLRHAPSFTQNV